VPRYRDAHQGPKKIVYFPVFCLKIATSEALPTGFRSKGLTSRLIQQEMTVGDPKQEWADKPEERDRRLNQIRDQLLAWRLYNYDQKLPELNLRAYRIKGRLREIYEPLLQVLYGLPDYEVLLTHLQQTARERAAELENSFEGKIVNAVWKLIGKTNETILPFEKLWSQLLADLEGETDGRTSHVMHTPDFGDITKHKVGYRVREVLGAKRDVVRSKQGKSVRAYLFNRDKLLRTAKRYGCYQVTEGTKSEGRDGQPTVPFRTKFEPNTNLAEAQRGSASLPELGKLSNSVAGGETANNTAVPPSRPPPPTPTSRRRKPLELEAVLPTSLSKS
jgi:hypothetical protein